MPILYRSVLILISCSFIWHKPRYHPKKGIFLLHRCCFLTLYVREINKKCCNLLQQFSKQHNTINIHYTYSIAYLHIYKYKQPHRLLLFFCSYPDHTFCPLLQYPWKLIFLEPDPSWHLLQILYIQTSSIHCVQERHLITNITTQWETEFLCGVEEWRVRWRDDEWAVNHTVSRRGWWNATLFHTIRKPLHFRWGM